MNTLAWEYILPVGSILDCILTLLKMASPKTQESLGIFLPRTVTLCIMTFKDGIYPWTEENRNQLVNITLEMGFQSQLTFNQFRGQSCSYVTFVLWRQCYVLAGCPVMIPRHHGNLSSVDSGRPVPIFFYCMFFAVYSSFGFTWNKPHLSSACYRFKIKSRSTLKCGKPSSFLPFQSMTVSGLLWRQFTRTQWPTWRLLKSEDSESIGKNLGALT